MKFSENWLRTLVNPPMDTTTLANTLTFGGIEVEAIEPAGPPFEGVVVGEVLSVARHPDADRLSVCEVDVGLARLTIVCGAPNVRAGMKVPTALVGAKLPGIEIKAAKVRGIESRGMLCSEKELGLSAEASGLMELPAEAAVGSNVREVLDLDDQIITTKLTPNRGDCLSILGLAREVAALVNAKLPPIAVGAVSESIRDALDVTLEARDACPLYCGRLIRGVNAQAVVPPWIKVRLERSGLRSISAIVDITNYVMLELGQPLHAFDVAKLSGGIRVRFARQGEKLELLNGETPELGADYLVIADTQKAVALAGIMGGAGTAVGDGTRDIFLESAFFSPDVIAGKSRALGFGSDSSFRFERGVDFGNTRGALERATLLVQEICGGNAGPITEAVAALPKRKPVALRLARASKVLGIEFASHEAGEILRRLNFKFNARAGDFDVEPPTYRFDITLEEDLIEELARIHGYEHIPASAPVASSQMQPLPEETRSRAEIRHLLVDRDYTEAVTYSFIDSRWEQDFCGNAAPVALANPIASHMNAMRSSLIPGLVTTAAFNMRHRQSRVRLFEIGRCFSRAGDVYVQPVRVGVVACGSALAEQWGAQPPRRVDFYDVKGDLEALIAPRELNVEPAPHPALHPGKSARIVLDGRAVGWIGELHPRWQQKYDLPLVPVVFEVDYATIAARVVPSYREVAKFPPVRRDLAALFDESIPLHGIIDALRRAAPPTVTDVRLFDVYRGKDLETGKKSLAFSILLQDTRKTLTDAEVDTAVSTLRDVVQQQFGAKLR